jgi:hypothetical protein
MKPHAARAKLTRRDLLSRSVAFGATALIVGPTFIAGSNAAWALSLDHLKPETMATLIRMARDIYPHDRIADEFYAAALKSYDMKDKVSEVEEGIADLNNAAIAKGFRSYADVDWERDRVDILRSMEDKPFFQTIRGGLVTGLYNQKAIWPIFGYEGESYSRGGYIQRGFDDINWL